MTQASAACSQAPVGPSAQRHGPCERRRRPYGRRRASCRGGPGRRRSPARTQQPREAPGRRFAGPLADLAWIRRTCPPSVRFGCAHVAPPSTSWIQVDRLTANPTVDLARDGTNWDMKKSTRDRELVKTSREAAPWTHGSRNGSRSNRKNQKRSPRRRQFCDWFSKVSRPSPSRKRQLAGACRRATDYRASTAAKHGFANPLPNPKIAVRGSTSNN